MTASPPTNPVPTDSTAGKYRPLPKGIWVLGFVSLFMDMSSELVHSLLPVFMAGVLGASMVTIGLIEGVAEATGSIVKFFQAPPATTSENARRS